MSKTYILRQQGQSQVLTDQDKLIKLISDSITEFESVMARIKANLNSEEFIPHYAFARAMIDKYGSICIMYGPPDRYIIDMSIKELEYLLAMGRSALERIQCGTLMDNDEVIYIEFDAWSSSGPTLYKGSIKVAAVCDQCDGPIIIERDTDIEVHKAGLECRERKHSQEINKLGLVRITDFEVEKELAKTRKIPIEYYSSGFDMYVPQWVNEAIQAYNINKYANMELHEYLNRMAELK